MEIESAVINAVINATMQATGFYADPSVIQVQRTRKDFEGDFTVVFFYLASMCKRPPGDLAVSIGELLQHSGLVSKYNVIKGFLNLTLDDSIWKSFFLESFKQEAYGFHQIKPEIRPVLIEYSSPNTNKPLHLGHIRNNLLGFSLAEILKASGYPVVRVNLVNDRGIHICKSMLAWKKWGEGETPASASMKGDHFVGKYYVMFDKKYREELAGLVASGMDEEEAQRTAPLILEAQEMLRQWEAHDAETLGLWKIMNDWVYEGFETTYYNLGVAFDKTYYESDTYLSGKRIVEEGLNSGYFYRKDDGSVWADLTDEGLDEKILLRSDGTSVYITQDLGTAVTRHDQLHPSRMIYVVGNEQNYHFEVLRTLLKKMKTGWWDSVHHFSYGMVELPHGKMKSREGTVVDADDLMDEMYRVAKSTTEELGKIEQFDAEEAVRLYQMLALGALKFFILKVDPKKNMLFNPEESIDFNGHTGPFIQYTHARICSLLRKAGDRYRPDMVDEDTERARLNDVERKLLISLYQFPGVVAQAGEQLSPALIANYIYELAKEYNHFYQEVPVLREEHDSTKAFRLMLSAFTGRVIKAGMAMLGIGVPERM